MNQSLKVSFYVWTIMGYVICPLTGYFTLPVDKNNSPFYISAMAACAAASLAIGTLNGEQDT